MNRTLKLFGRFFVFAIAITIFSFSIFTFSSAPVYAEGSFAFTNHLELGVVSNDVKELQILLNSKGYNVGIPDGKFGPTTKAQVILFQKANGLTPDGIVGEGVRAFLNGTSTITPTTKTTTTPTIQTTTPKVTTTTSTTPVSLNRTLKLTIPIMKGDDVKALQTFLNNLGYNTGTPDGSFGPKTEAQVKLFQIANNLTPDGKAGKITLSLINPNSNNQTFTSGCTSSLGFSIITGQSCANTLIVSTLGCTSGALFNTTTGASCGTLSVLPTGCTSTSLFSTTSGVSCTTGLPATPILKLSGGGSSGNSIYVISTRAISGVTIPAGGATPTSSIASTGEYTASIAWNGNPTTFSGNTSYTAVITIVPKSRYTLTGVTADFFTVAGATSTNLVDSGVITAVFPISSLTQLTISNPTITTSKVYNGNTTAVVTAGTLSGIVNSETVTVSATATYDTKIVSTGKTIIVTYTITGANASQYIKPIDYTTSLGIITPIQLTIANPTLTTQKEYDRSTIATVTAGALTGVVDEGVTVSAVANYDSLNRGEAKTITVVYTLSGTNAGNYIKPVDRVEYSGSITQKQLTINSPTLTLTKIYDGTNTATVTAGSLMGIVSGEDVSIASAVATYDTASAGTGKTITVFYTITGASAANYIKPENGPTSSGIITKANVSAPNAPTFASKTNTSITLAANSLNEFSINSGSTWQSSEVFTSLTPSTSYTFVARVKATSNTNESPASVAGASIMTDEIVYNLRDIGTGGGLVFYDKGSYSNGWRYLEAAPAPDQSTGIIWAVSTPTNYQSTSVPGTSTDIGTGSANTDLIIAQNGAGTTYAAGIARAYTGGGKSGWFLPSKDELNEMYINLWRGTNDRNGVLSYTPVGGFTTASYWSSSEYDAVYAWRQAFGNGTQDLNVKSTMFYVRAVRAF